MELLTDSSTSSPVRISPSLKCLLSVEATRLQVSLRLGFPPRYARLRTAQEGRDQDQSDREKDKSVRTRRTLQQSQATLRWASKAERIRCSADHLPPLLLLTQSSESQESSFKACCP